MIFLRFHNEASSCSSPKTNKIFADPCKNRKRNLNKYPEKFPKSVVWLYLQMCKGQIRKEHYLISFKSGNFCSNYVMNLSTKIDTLFGVSAGKNKILNWPKDYLAMKTYLAGAPLRKKTHPKVYINNFLEETIF